MQPALRPQNDEDIFAELGRSVKVHQRCVCVGGIVAPKKPKQGGNANKIIFRAGTRIGYPAAEDDRELLDECFVEMGVSEALLDIEGPGSIVLGRTGSGKSAVLIHIKAGQENVIEIEPSDLALNYISNSNVIAFFSSIGVNFDLFYRLLWRHVLCVELLNYHYNVRKRHDFERAMETLGGLFGGNPSKKHALAYLQTWGGQFWEETQERIKELVEKFEDQLKAGVDLTGLSIPLSASASTTIEESRKTEIVQQATRVVNTIQIRQLSAVMDILADDIFDDIKRKHYIVVDRLDENWIEDQTKLKLIRALLETIRDFKKVRSVKILVAMRTDLIERVFNYTRDLGFQEEKYDAINVPLKWSKDSLLNLINLRINTVFKKKYTKENIKFSDLFDENYRGNTPTVDYLINRTQMRPRDIISFINQIFEEVSGKDRVSSRDIERAETEYSKKRLIALCTEWQAEHPHLETCLETLRRLPSRIDLQVMSEELLEGAIMALSEKADSPDGLPEAARQFIGGSLSFSDVRGKILGLLYKTGAIGIRLRHGEPVHFTYTSSFAFRSPDLTDDSKVSIAPMLWAALGVVRQRVRGELTEQ